MFALRQVSLPGLVRSRLYTSHRPSSSIFYAVALSRCQRPAHFALVSARHYTSFWDDFKKRVKEGVSRNPELKKTIDELKEKEKKITESKVVQATQTVARKAKEGISDTAEGLAEKVSEGAQRLAETPVVRKPVELFEKLEKPINRIRDHAASQAVSRVITHVIEELDKDNIDTTPYRRRPPRPSEAPEQPSSSASASTEPGDSVSGEQTSGAAGGVEGNEAAARRAAEARMGLVLYKRKRSYFEQTWHALKDKAEGNPVLLGSLLLGESVASSVGGALGNVADKLFGETETALVLREMKERDPELHIPSLVRYLRDDLIRIVLEAYFKGDLATLKPYCSDEIYRVLMTSVRERQADGMHIDSKILTIGSVQLHSAKIIDQYGPVLIFTFNVQQTNCIRDRWGNIVEGAIDDIRRLRYIWAMQRDPDSPTIFFRLLEMHAATNDKFV